MVIKESHSGLTESLFHLFPVDDAPESSEVVGAAILIVEVVGVFPHIKRE